MGAALACKRDADRCTDEKIKKVADGMTERQLEDFARKPLVGKTKKR